MTATNALMDLWSNAEPSFGVWCTIPSTFTAELVAARDVDFVGVDQQHGLLASSHVAPLCQAITAGGSLPVARVQWNEPAAIMTTLDAGALGVIVPMVDSAEDARRAVSACRFPPHGVRSFGPVRASIVHQSIDPDVLSQVACVAMVETAGGLHHVDDIAATPGLDGIYIGPNDLALALGLRPGAGFADERFTDALTAIRTACSRHGIAAGIHAATGETARIYAEQSFDFITVSSDAAALSSGVEQQLASARGAAATLPQGASRGF